MKPARITVLLGAFVTAAAAVVGCSSGDGASIVPSTSPSGPTPGTVYAVPSRDHVQGSVAYPQTPPVGGDHNAVWQNCGVYDRSVANENAVHSLEHGAVWITYDPQLDAPRVAALAALAIGQTHVLVSPFEGTPSPVVASAWGVQQRFESAADPGIAAFIQAYQLSPQSPEPGAPCTRGIGEPQ